MLKNPLRPLLTRLEQICASGVRSEKRRVRNRILKSTGRQYYSGGDVATESIVLESRALLAARLGFEITTIASDLSSTERFFGSPSPADAPFTILRYGFGTATSIQDLPDLQAAIGAPGNLTFSFGTSNISSPMEVVTLSSFDDGLADGLANQIYTPDGNDNPAVTFFNAGIPVATGVLSKLSLQTTPSFSVSSPDTAPTRIVLSGAVGANTSVYDAMLKATGGTGVIDITLSAFNLQGPWTGVGDAEEFTSNGRTLGLVSDSASLENGIVGEQRYFGAIASPGDQDTFTFTLASPSRLWLDGLSFDNNETRFTLIGPSGVVQSNLPLTDDADLGLLPAGAYTAVVSGSGSFTGPFAFRIRDLASATPVTAGTSAVPTGAVVQGQLSPGNETNVFRFTANAGDELLFDNVSLSEDPQNQGFPDWRLIDSFGNQLFLDSLGQDQSSVTMPTTGTYTLIVASSVFENDFTAYSFRIDWLSFTAPPAVPGTTLTLGNTVSSNISVALEDDFYKFTLSSPTRLWFDSMTEDSLNARWNLTGPQGVIQSDYVFSSDDLSLGLLPAGTYSLRVSAANPGNYSFRVLDLAAATPLPTVPATLNPSNSTNLHQFNGTQGQIFYFDNTSFSTTDTTGLTFASSWSLYDQYGTQLFFQYVGNDGGRIVLPNTGTYTVVVQGYISTDGTTTYGFSAIPVTDDNFALTLGTTYSSSISTLGQQDNYSFTLSSPARLWFDSMTEDGLNTRWTLTGPQGVLQSNYLFSSDDLSLGLLPAGTYSLRVSAANPGNYSFRVLDLAAATPLPTVPATLNPSNSTNLHQFNGTQGQIFYFDNTSFSTTDTTGLTFASSWSLYDQFGTQLFIQSIAADGGRIVLPNTGTYTVVVQGYISTDGTTTELRIPVRSVHSVSRTTIHLRCLLQLGCGLTA
jgi:hypothetical protein